MKRYDLIVIGAGPAGLSAATEAAKHGLHPLVLDENEKPGGQLFKQIHKFFGSKEHKAKIRGFKIGEELLAEAEKYGVEVMLNATVIGLYPEKEITVRIGDEVKHMKVPGLDTSGCNRSRCSADDDEPSPYQSRRKDSDAWNR